MGNLCTVASVLNLNTLPVLRSVYRKTSLCYALQLTSCFSSRNRVAKRYLKGNHTLLPSSFSLTCFYQPMGQGLKKTAVRIYIHK